MFRMENVLRFQPITTLEWVFFVASLLAALLAFWFIHLVYRLPGPTWLGCAAAYLMSLCISFLPVQLIAHFYEGRDIWLPGNHSAIFFWGDGIGLPAMAAGFAYLRRSLAIPHPLADRRWWRFATVIVALGISFLYHLSQTDLWTKTRLHQPSKDWHDFAVYPIFIYFLGSQIPFLISALKRWHYGDPRRRRLITAVAVILAGFGFWAWTGTIYDPTHIHAQPLLGFALNQLPRR